jgi:hypothetical protein
MDLPGENPLIRKCLRMLPQRTRAVFISYAHADNESGTPKERWLDRFVEFLKPLVRQEDFTLCSDQEVKIGEDWQPRSVVPRSCNRKPVKLTEPSARPGAETPLGLSFSFVGCRRRRWRVQV